MRPLNSDQRTFFHMALYLSLAIAAIPPWEKEAIHNNAFADKGLVVSMQQSNNFCASDYSFIASPPSSSARIDVVRFLIGFLSLWLFFGGLIVLYGKREEKAAGATAPGGSAPGGEFITATLLPAETPIKP